MRDLNGFIPSRAHYCFSQLLRWPLSISRIQLSHIANHFLSFPFIFVIIFIFWRGVGRGLFIERSRKRGVTQDKPNENNATIIL